MNFLRKTLFYEKRVSKYGLLTVRSPGIDSVSIWILAGRYDNPIPTRFLAPIDNSKILARSYFLRHFAFTYKNTKTNLQYSKQKKRKH